jgi:glycosyltransferase involved in cell wall biosynthesis
VRVLALAAIPPRPPNHAMRRIMWNLLTRLPHDVHLVTWEAPDTTEDDVDEILGRLPLTTVLPRRPAPLGRGARARRQGRFLLGGWPPFVQEMLEQRDLADPAGARRFSALIEDMHSRTPFDLVVALEEAMRAVPLPLLDVPVVVYRHNRLSDVLQGQRSSSLLARAYWRIERAAWDRFDRRSTAGVAMAVANTPELAAAVSAGHPGVPVRVVPTGTDVRPLSNPPSAGADVAFVGWMSYEPNVDAATWFAREVWPQLRERHPGSCFRIVGKDPGPEVRALADADAGVVVTGEVPDITDALEGCRVAVVPLRRGMGLKTKTIEALALGLPVVSLPTGREGVAAGPADGLLPAADAASMAAALRALLDDGERADALGAAGREWVGRHHSWAAAGAAFTEAIEAAVR